MINRLGLLLFVWTVGVTSTWSSNERVSFIPSIATQLQRQNFRRVSLFPKSGRRDFQRLMLIKHLLELKCLKHLCNYNYCKPGQSCQNSYDAVRPLAYDQYREDQNSRRYSSGDRVIYPPPTVYFINKPINVPVNNIPSRDVTGISQWKKVQEGELNQNAESNNSYDDYVHIPAQEGVGRAAEEKFEDNPGILSGNDELPKPGHVSYDRFSNQARFNTSNLFRPQLSRKQVGQYEVKEIVDEKSPDEYEDDSKRTFEEPVLEEQKAKPDTDKKKVESFLDVKSNKLKAALKNLLNSIIKNETMKQSHHNISQFTIAPPERNYSTNLPREYVGGRAHHRYEQQKQLKFLSPHSYQDRGRSAPEEAAVDFESNASYSNFSKFNLKTDHKGRLNASGRFIITTERISKFSFTPSGVGISGKIVNHTDFIKSSRHKVIDANPSEPLDSLESLNMPDIATITGQQLKDYGFIPSERTSKMSTTQQMPESEKPLMNFVTSSETETTSNVISQSSREFVTTKTDLSDEDSDNSIGTDLKFPENEESYTTALNVEAFEYFSEATVKKADFTAPKFEEFTDQPLLFDLFPEVRKDPDAKNSRKMHFGHESPVTPKSNQIPEDGSHRRSDILIYDNLDYLDYDASMSSPNYLEKLRLNNSLISKNFTSDSVIPLIPIVINDLRDDKISPEDIPLLSETFGKHWPTVLNLSNNTNLDMLPLMKMKDENDLENVLKSFGSESIEGTTTEKTDSSLNKNFYYDLYEYMDKDLYKDLYKDLLDISEGKKPDLNYEAEEVEKDGSKSDLLR